LERTLAGSAPPPKPCVAAARDAAATPDAAVLAARGIVLRTPGCNACSNGTPEPGPASLTCCAAASTAGGGGGISGVGSGAPTAAISPPPAPGGAWDGVVSTSLSAGPGRAGTTVGASAARGVSGPAGVQSAHLSEGHTRTRAGAAF